MYTLPKTNIAPENRPSQKESSLATPFLRGYVGFRECFYSTMFNYKQFRLQYVWKKGIRKKEPLLHILNPFCEKVHETTIRPILWGVCQISPKLYLKISQFMS